MTQPITMSKSRHPKTHQPNVITTDGLNITSLIPGGQGIATLPDGKKAMLWNALPGEIVTEFTVTRNKSHYIEGIATRISHPSPHRLTPEDDCYLSTSPWQIMDYDYELSQKSLVLQETFRQFGLRVCMTAESSFEGLPEPGKARISAETPVATGVSDAVRKRTVQQSSLPLVRTDGKFYHYRNKMEYSLYFSHEDEKIHLAFHQRGSHRKIPITKSSLERPEIFAKATKIVDQLNAEHAEARDFQSLLLRCNQAGEVSGGLYRNHQPHPEFPPLTDTILGHTYSYSPNGFFQINLPVYELALREIKKHIHTNKVLDLYSGVGTIGLSVSPDHDLTLVEVDKSAFRELEKNCEMTLSSSSPHPILSKSEDALSYITPDQTVILDPPRAGCAPALIERLLEVTPPTIIYLSCNPSTQARDLSLLTKSGRYDIIGIIPFNFFPRTPHLENLVILNQAKNH